MGHRSGEQFGCESVCVLLVEVRFLNWAVILCIQLLIYLGEKMYKGSSVFNDYFSLLQMYLCISQRCLFLFQPCYLYSWLSFVCYVVAIDWLASSINLILTHSLPSSQHLRSTSVYASLPQAQPLRSKICSVYTVKDRNCNDNGPCVQFSSYCPLSSSWFQLSSSRDRFCTNVFVRSSQFTSFSTELLVWNLGSFLKSQNKQTNQHNTILFVVDHTLFIELI